MLTAAVCTIGDEILIGQIIDTNSSHISKALNSIGVKVQYMSSIGDDRNEIVSTLRSAIQSYDIVIVTGGLGPTKDDITKGALAELYGSDGYYESPEQMEIVKRILTFRGIELSDINRLQASVPNGCEVIPNQIGTAPCMVFRFPKPHTTTLYSLPGVPFEALALLPDIISDIKSHYTLEDIHHKTLVTFGIPESTLSKMIESWEDTLPNDIKLAYLPNPTIGVRLRLSIYGGDKSDEIQRIDQQFDKLKPILGEAIYGEGEESLQIVIGRMLRDQHLTMSTVESCTGGRISSLITSVPGSSDYYIGSVISYSNDIKESVLKVPHEVIATHGAVSKECVEAMALGVKRVMKTDFSVATSGIAGPGGGSPEKPVGMAWIAVAYTNSLTLKEEVISTKVSFKSDREHNIERFASHALNLLRLQIAKL